MKPYRLLSASERAAVHDHWDDLLDAACEARREGWAVWEVDPVASAARALGVTLWPGAARRLTREARDLMAAA